MIGLDTNVLVRLVTGDNPPQVAIARNVVRDAGDGELFVGLIVLAELAWVLDRTYGYPPQRIAQAIASFLAGREFTIERPELAEQALQDSAKAGCGYADALIALVAHEGGAGTMLTFDTRAGRLPLMQLLKVK